MKNLFKKASLFLLVLVLFPALVFAGWNQVVLLNAVTATGASDAENVSGYSRKTVYIIASSVTTGATVKLQTSYDNSNWVDFNTQTITASGTTEIAANGFLHKWLRANITSRTDGTYTVVLGAD